MPEQSARTPSLPVQRTLVQQHLTLLETQQAVTTAAGDLDAVLQALVAGVLRALPQAEGGVIELREGDDLVYRATAGVLAGHAGLRVPLRGSLAGRSYLHAVPLRIADACDAQGANQILLERLGVRACLLVPVAGEGAIIGVLKLQASRPNAFSAEDLQVAQLFAGIAAGGLAQVGEATARRAVRRSETRYRAVFESATDFALIATDRNGNVTDWNSGAEQIFGWTAGEMHGQPAERFFTPEDRAIDRVAIEMHDALTTGRANDERWHLRKDGSRFWASGDMMPLRDGGDEHLGYLKVLRDRTEQHLAGQRLVESEARYRGLFEAIDDGFCIIETKYDDRGRPVDYRFVEVNPAFANQTGLVDAEGRWMRDLAPAHEQHWFDRFGEVARTGQPVRFEEQGGALGRVFEGYAFRIGAPEHQRVAILFRDITARRASERRKSAMVELGDRLRDLTDIEQIAATGAEIMAQALGATRAGYGSVDHAYDSVVVPTDWCAPGTISIIGPHHFRNYGSFVDDLKRGTVVIIPDVTTDPRTRDRIAALSRIGVRALINVPILERGQLAFVAFAHDGTAHAWSPEEQTFVRAVADRVQAAIGQVRAEQQQRVLNHELSHRMKNMLAMVQAIATQTMRTATDLEVARDTLAARLIALGKAHDILLTGETHSAPLETVIRNALKLHDDRRPGRFEIVGPAVRVGSKAALSLALLLHELATNAAKYGALSVPDGGVELCWTVEGPIGVETVCLFWREHGGPPVRPPAHTGFGTRLITRGLAGSFDGTVDLSYPPEGVCCTIKTTLTGLAAE
jgi:PAS domain S-box-containing protein